MNQKNYGGITRLIYPREYLNCYGSDDEWAEKCRNKIRNILTNPPIISLQKVAVGNAMRFIAENLASHGTILCCQNKIEGWKMIKHGFYYEYFAQKILFESRNKLISSISDDEECDEEDDDGDIYVPDVMELQNLIGIGFSLAFQETEFFLREVEKSLQNGQFEWHKDDFYMEYFVRLFQKIQKRDVLIPTQTPFCKKWNPPFDAVFTHWEDDQNLIHAMYAMLDYHLKWNFDKTNNHYAEFRSHFTMINPVEIHALEYVRSSLGLSTPKLKHELLQFPFYPIPEFIYSVTLDTILAEDELLQKIVHDSNSWFQEYLSGAPSFLSQKNNEDVHLLKETLPTKDTLSTVKSTPVENKNIRAYFLSVEQLQKLFGSKNLSLLESFDFSPYHSNQVYTATKYLLEGIDNSPDISSTDYALAWEILCHHVGKKINIEDFQQVNIPARNVFESIMIPMEMVSGEKETLGYMMKQFMIKEFLETINIESTDSTDPEQETALGFGILMQIAAHVQNSDNQQTTTDDNQLQKDPDFINTSLGIASLLLQAIKEKQDLMIFLSPTPAVDGEI
jgi:hypothetical protein